MLLLKVRIYIIFYLYYEKSNQYQLTSIFIVDESVVCFSIHRFSLSTVMLLICSVCPTDSPQVQYFHMFITIEENQKILTTKKKTRGCFKKWLHQCCNNRYHYWSIWPLFSWWIDQLFVVVFESWGSRLVYGIEIYSVDFDGRLNKSRMLLNQRQKIMQVCSPLQKSRLSTTVSDT